MKNEINDMMYEQDRIVLDNMIDNVDDLLQAASKLKDAIDHSIASRTWGTQRLTENWHLNEDEASIRHAYKTLEEIIDLYAHHINEADAELEEEDDGEEDVNQ